MDTPQFAAFWLIAWPLLLGLGAVGALLFIKTTRRRQAMHNPAYTDVVPARPLSAADAARMRRRYLWIAGVLLLSLLLAGTLIGGASW